MANNELKRIIKQLKTQGKMNFLEEATEEQIDSFEKNYDIKLPVKYREWLLLSDGGECFLPAGVQFYGVAHKPLIDVEDSDRPSDKYVVIGALASGDPIVFEKNKENISIYNHETGRIEDDEIYDDFYLFLKDMYNMLGIGG